MLENVDTKRVQKIKILHISLFFINFTMIFREGIVVGTNNCGNLHGKCIIINLLRKQWMADPQKEEGWWKRVKVMGKLKRNRNCVKTIKPPRKRPKKPVFCAISIQIYFWCIHFPLLLFTFSLEKWHPRASWNALQSWGESLCGQWYLKLACNFLVILKAPF